MATITWKTGSSGLWSDAADWSTGATPTATSAVVISAAPAVSATPYTVSLESSVSVASVTLDQSLATLEIDYSTLTVSTAFSLTAGTLYLNQSTLQGGTYASTSGTVLSSYGTLASLTSEGTLDLAAENGTSNVTLEAISFAGVGDSGSGSLVLGTGLTTTIEEASLSKVNVNLASGASIYAGTSTATSFVIGSNTTITTTGSLVNGYLPQTNLDLTTGGLLENNGLIKDASGAYLVISATSFENSGTISASSGGTIDISTSGATTDTNTGLLSVGTGGYLDLTSSVADAFTSTGSVSVAGTLGLDFALTTAELAAFPVTTGTLAIQGTLTNTSGTLTTGSGTKIANLWLDGGEIAGGAIVSKSSFVATSGTLSGASVQGTFLVQTPSANSGGATVSILGSLAMSGTGGTGIGTIAMNGGNLDFLTSTTLSNTSIVIDSSSTNTDIDAGYFIESTGTTLIFAANDQISQSGSYSAAYLNVESASDSLINEGTITAAAENGYLDATGLINAGLVSVSNGETFNWAPYYSSNSTSIVNSGTVVVNGGNLSLNGYNTTFDNTGLLALYGNTSAQTDLISLPSLVNSGTIQVSGNTELALGAYGASWSNTGTFIISGGEILLDGSFTAAQIGKADIADGGELAIGGTLTNTGTLAIGTGNPLSTIGLAGSGEISGGTITDAGGGLVAQGGTLYGVTYKGTLNLGVADSSLTIADGTTVASASGSGAGTILLTGNYSSLYIEGSDTLSNTIFDIGANDANGSYYDDTVFFTDLQSAATTLTISANSSMVQVAQNMNFYGNYGGSAILGDTIVNDGSITETLAGSSLTFYATNILNSGTIRIGDGSHFDVSDATLTNKGTIVISGSETTNSATVSAELSFGSYEQAEAITNAGLIKVDAGGLLSLDAPGETPGTSALTWTNTGTILLAGGGLDLGGTITTAQLGKISVSEGGFISIDAGGTLNNTGATLTVGGTSALGTVSAAGTLHGGTIIDDGSGIYLAGLFGSDGIVSGGDLDDVKYEGVLNIAGLDENAAITGGISLTGTNGSGTGSIDLTGIGAVLDFAGTETITGATISIGSGVEVDPVTEDTSYGVLLTGADLTLSNDVIEQTGEYAEIGYSDGSDSSTITNTGNILFALSGGEGLELAGDIVNSGTIAVSNGETLYLDTTSLTNTGTISVTNGLLEVGDVTSNQLTEVKLVNSVFAVTGTVTATGSTITVGTGTSLPYIELEGEILGGTIKDEGGGIGFFGTSFLNGVTYEGTLSINRPLAFVVIENSFNATDITGKLPGSISITGADSELIWDSSQTLNNATISIGNASESYEGYGLYGPALVSEYYYDVPFTLGAQLTINQSGTYADIGGFAYYGSEALAKTATGVAAPGDYSTVSAATIDAGVSGGNLSLEGEYFSSTGTIAISNKDTVTEGAASFTNAGVITIGTASTLSLNLLNYFGYGILNPESFTNSGSISLAGGTITEATDNGTFPSVPMLNATGGTLSGFGSVAAEIINDGLITASGGTLTLGQAITGTGTLAVDKGATLSLTSISSGQTATFSGTGGILGLAPASFLGEIGGFASGDTIDLASTKGTAASFSGTSLVVTLSTGSTIKLTTTTALTGTLKTTAGTHGDTLITFAAAAIGGPHSPLPILPPMAPEDVPAITDPLGAPALSQPTHPLETLATHLTQ